MTKIVRASAVQISPVLYNREATTAKVVEKIRELGKEGVQFATFPRSSGPLLSLFRRGAVARRPTIRRRISAPARPGRGHSLADH